MVIAWIRKHQLVAFFFLTYLITYGSQFSFVLLRPGQPLNSWSLVWFISVFGPSWAALLLSAFLGG